MSEKLMHYGVLGMRWGIRRTPELLGYSPIRLRRSPKELGYKPNEGEYGDTIQKKARLTYGYFDG